MSDHTRSTQVEAAGVVRPAAASQNPTLAGENRQASQADGAAGGGALELALRCLLASPAAAADRAAEATIEAWPSLAERQRLWERPELWGDPLWTTTERDPTPWRQRVDPLPALERDLGLWDAPRRMDLLAEACAQPTLRERAAASLPVLSAATEGLDPLQALRVQQLLATGAAPPDDLFLLLYPLLQSQPAAAVAALRLALPQDRALALRLAEDRELLRRLRDADPALADEVDTLCHGALAGAPSEGSGLRWLQDESPVNDLRDDLARARTHAAVLGGLVDRARDIGPEVLGALTRARARLAELAAQDGATGSRVEARVRAALRLGAERYAEGASLLELLECIDDPYSRRRAAQLLGREGDALALARANLGAGPRDRAAAEALLEACGRTGAALAEAVARGDEARALTIAEHHARSLAEAQARGSLRPGDGPAALAALEAGYALAGGDLRHGVARLEGADTVFLRLGLRSTALALRAADDTRPDEVVQAEHDAIGRLDTLFVTLVDADPSPALALTTPAPDGLLHPATLVAPDAPVRWLDQRYEATYGLSLGAHLERADIDFAHKLTLARRLQVRLGAAPPPAAEEGALHTLRPSFFEIDKRPIPGLSPGAPTKADAERATRAHVDHLGALADALDAEYSKGDDPQKALLAYLARLQLSGGEDRVLAGYRAQHGVSIQFALQRARTRGRLDDRSAEVALRTVRPTDLAPVCVELRGLADAGQWDEVLAAVNHRRFTGARREALLSDGATLAYLRGRAPGADAWDLFYRSAKGELGEAELLARDSNLAAWGSTRRLSDANEGGMASIRRGLSTVLSSVGLLDQHVELQLSDGRRDLSQADDPLMAMLTGDTVSSFALDTQRLLALRDEGLKGDALRERRAARLTDRDVQYRLQRQEGGGRDRRRAELKLLGREHQGEALDAENDWLGWGSLPALREGISAMSPDEREAARRDLSFREHLREVSDGDAGAYEDLVDLLDHGEEALASQLHAAEGTGVESRWFGADAWAVVRALGKAPPSELSRIASDPALRGHYLAQAARDDDASAALHELFDTALAQVNLEVQAQDAPADAAKALQSVTAQADLALFVARERALLVGALERETSEVEVAKALLDLATHVREARERGVSWDPSLVAERLRPPVTAASHARYGEYTGEGADFILVLFELAAKGAEDLPVKLIARAGDDEEVILAAIAAAPDELVATQWSSLRATSLAGKESLHAVYRRYRAAREAATDAPPDSPLATARDEARLALQNHPVDLSLGALHIDTAEGVRAGGQAEDLEDLSPDVWKKARAAARERVRKLPAPLVHATVGVEPEDQHLVWDAGMRSSLVLAELDDRSQGALGTTSWLFDALSDSDNRAALHLATVAQQVDLGRDLELTEDELARYTAMAKAVGGSLKEYEAARDTAAEIASWTASLVVSTLVTVCSGGAGAPLTAQLLATGLSGLASVLVKEAMLGDHYEAEEATRRLAIQLVSAAISGGASELGAGLLASKSAKALTNGKVGEFVRGAQEQARRQLGSAGADAAGAVALAAVQVPWEHIEEAAWVAVHEGVVGRGWQDGLDRGLLSLESSLADMPLETAQAIIEAVAEKLGEQAIAEEQVPTDKQLSGGVADKSPRASDLRTLLLARLGDVGEDTREKALQSVVQELSQAGMEEGLAWAQSGELELTEARWTGALAAAAKSTSKGAIKSGVKQGVSLTQQVQRSRYQAEAKRLLEASSLQVKGEERDAFLAWAAARQEDLGDAVSEGPLVRAHAEFAQTVWVPLASATPQRDDDLAKAWRKWVLKDPAKARERLDSLPFSLYVERAQSVESALQTQRASAAYQALSEHERRWFDHAAAHPEALADLSKDRPKAAIDLQDPEQLDAFREGVRQTSLALARAWVDEEARDTDDEAKRAFIERCAEPLARSVSEAHPADVAARCALQDRIETQWDRARTSGGPHN